MATIDEQSVLAGPALAQAIQFVTAGRGVRCAVAFWSENGIAEVFPSGVPADAKVLCDIWMGGTSEEALRKLSGVLGERLKHAPEMHAKVYISSAGVVIASANASKVAMVSDGRPGSRLEVGTFYRADSAVYEAATLLFKTHFKRGGEVGEKEFAIARRRFRPPLPKPTSPLSGSLLDMVIADPRSFRSIGFVFTSTSSDEQDRARVRRLAREKGISQQEVRRYKNGTFTGWGPREVKKWPSFFFEFYQPRKKLRVYARRLDHRFEDNVLANSDWVGMTDILAFSLPTRKAIETADAVTALKFRSDDGGRFFESGEKLVEWLRESSGSS